LWHIQGLSDAQFTANADEITAKLLGVGLALPRDPKVSQQALAIRVARYGRGAAIHLIRAV
jgi:hypothetical protein